MDGSPRNGGRLCDVKWKPLLLCDGDVGDAIRGRWLLGNMTCGVYTGRMFVAAAENGDIDRTDGRRTPPLAAALDGASTLRLRRPSNERTCRRGAGTRLLVDGIRPVI